MALTVVVGIAALIGGAALGAYWQQWRWRTRTGGEARWLRRAIWDGTIVNSGQVGDMLPRLVATQGPLKEFVRLHTIECSGRELRERLDEVRTELAKMGERVHESCEIVVTMMTIRAEQPGYWDRELGHVLGQVCLEAHHLLRRVAQMATVDDRTLWLVFQAVMISWAQRSLSDNEFAKGLRSAGPADPHGATPEEQGE